MTAATLSSPAARASTAVKARGPIRSVIVGTGSFIPPLRIPNEHFLDRDFRTADGQPISKPGVEVIAQFENITGIRERRWVSDDLVTSDIAFEAARDALESSEIDA